MEKYVITVSRRFGSMGHEIARQLSKRLGIPMYDRTDIEAAVRRENLDVKLEAEYMRSGSAVQENGMRERLRRKKETRQILPDEEQIRFQAQSAVVRQLADEQSCLILGRCADQILKDRPRCMNVFLYAPDEVRLENCMKLLHTDREAARSLIAREDQTRDAYRRRFVTDGQDVTEGRHILLDTSFLGVQESAALLEHAVHSLFD